jgi:hypothetical protein
MSDLARPHGSRFRDALVIVNPGACNPSGITDSIVNACREMREHQNASTDALRRDATIRLMVYQLASLIFDLSVDNQMYDQDLAYCKRRWLWS